MRSSGKLDSSFAGFVNPLDSVGNEDDNNLELVFHNRMLLEMIGLNSKDDLENILREQSFINCDSKNKLSLVSAASSRYSNEILNQTYRVERGL